MSDYRQQQELEEEERFMTENNDVYVNSRDYRQDQCIEDAQPKAINYNSEFPAVVWKKLSRIDVGKHIEEKNELKYLSWAWAWGVLMDNYPCSSFEIMPPEKNYDKTMMVWVRVRVSDGIDSLVREMWLPVLDYSNKAIQEPNAMQINTARMRCLTKCLALFGLGHYIYGGEDVPHQPSKEQIKKEKEATLINFNRTYAESIKQMKELMTIDDPFGVKELLLEIPEEVRGCLTAAPTKFTNAPLTTSEIKYLRSDLFTRTADNLSEMGK